MIIFLLLVLYVKCNSVRCQQYVGDDCKRFYAGDDQVFVPIKAIKSNKDGKINEIVKKASNLVKLNGCDDVYRDLMCAVKYPRCTEEGRAPSVLCQTSCQAMKKHICIIELQKANPILASVLQSKDCSSFSNESGCRELGKTSSK